MKKTTLIFLSLLVQLIACAAADRPNIIFLLTDDQTIGALGCYGNPDIITPNIDRLAQQGVRFENHYDTTSICMASRVCILTGLYEYRHGCNFGHGDLQRTIYKNYSYTEQLRNADYFVGFAGKIGFDIKDEPFDEMAKSFDVWGCGPSQTSYATAKNRTMRQYATAYPHSTRSYGAWAQDFFKAAKASGKPFCMNISFKAPHMPHTPDPIDLKRYEHIKTFRRPGNFGEENGAHLAPQAWQTRAATQYRNWVNDYDESIRKYYALISGVDAAVGMIREGLAREGLAQNTVIIFTGDNGYNTSSHGFGGKVIPYEEGTKSPLIVFDPRLPVEYRGQVRTAITANVDIAPTIFELSGNAAPADIDGKSIVPLLSSASAKIHDYLPLFNFWGVAEGQSMAIVTPEWKYIYWYSENKGMKATDELFHLSKDRLEMANVATHPEYAHIMASLKKAYDSEVATIRRQNLEGHRYEAFPTVFNRTIPWESKAPLARSYQGREPKKGAHLKPKK